MKLAAGGPRVYQRYIDMTENGIVDRLVGS